jgi:tRNA (guanine37-N1)-methyltransferase
MKFKVFTLLPQLFESFVSTSLIARAISKNIISINTINWRDNYGIGNYHQVDDKPYGGGSGMVLMADPIFRALSDSDSLGYFANTLDLASDPVIHNKILPNNSRFYSKVEDLKNTQSPIKKVTISLTPKGYKFDQKIAKWLTNFDEISILCGRYEGFDARVSEVVDLELSIGDYITNGGEIPSMVLIEAVSRLLPDFVTKNGSVDHDSYSVSNNDYEENKEYIIGARRLKQLTETNSKKLDLINKKPDLQNINLFDEGEYFQKILPFIEHPVYTRPQTWKNLQVPNEAISGDHKIVSKWRKKWY